MPSANHVVRGSTSTPTPLPPSAGQTDRSKILAGDVCVGCIVWLPPINHHDEVVRCCKTSCCAQKELEDAGYNHPVVVLSIRQRKNSTISGDIICKVACVTTFSDITLEKYLKKRSRLGPSIPIHHSKDDDETSPATTSSHIELKLEKRYLKKQSYIRLAHTYNIPICLLRNYGYYRSRAYKIRLSHSSYLALMHQLRLSPEPYRNTETLFETEQERLLALVMSEAVGRRSRVEVQLGRRSTLSYGRSDATPSYGGTTPLNVFTPRYNPPSMTYDSGYVPGGHSTPDDSCSKRSIVLLVAALLGIGSIVLWFSS